MTESKELYESISISCMEFSKSARIICGSIISESTIQSTGQEIGKEYDFSTGQGADAGKQFNHEWE